MKKDNVIKIKSFLFAVRVVNLYKFLTEDKREFIISKQLLRSGTSIGANVREAEHAESKADYISIQNDIKEILKLLTSIIKTSKQK